MTRMAPLSSLPVLASLLALSPLARGDSQARGDKPAETHHEVQSIRDIVYRDLAPGEDAALGKNKLDLFLPKDRKDFPVLFFVHGGGWRTGDKNKYLGFYSNVGLFLARHGIGAVVTNYRLSPAVQHPEHIKDVAKAFAWTYRNIAKYGGRPDQIFACGHSAGGHLVALLATDESYLKAEGLTRAALKGVIPISGVYDVSPPLGLFDTVFGKDDAVRKLASPLAHVAAGLPPFLIIYADKDFLTCDKVSEALCAALKGKNCPASTLEVKDRNHITVLARLTTAEDPAGKAILDFIAAHTPGKQAATGGR